MKKLFCIGLLIMVFASCRKHLNDVSKKKFTIIKCTNNEAIWVDETGKEVQHLFYGPAIIDISKYHGLDTFLNAIKTSSCIIK